MLNTNKQLDFYQNTSFSQTEHDNLKSKILNFGEVFVVALNLFKHRIGNLFLPVLIWQLLLAIAYISILIGGILLGVTVSSSPVIVGILFLLLIILSTCYLFMAAWIETKAKFMINDNTSKVFDNNKMVAKFFHLVGFGVLFFLAYALVVFPIQTISEATANAPIGVVLGLVFLLVTIVISYIEVFVNYVTRLYIVEDHGFIQSIGTMFEAVKRFLSGDILRQFIMGLIVSVIGFIANYGFLQLPYAKELSLAAKINQTSLADINIPQESLIPTLVTLGAASLVFIIIAIIIGWFMECFNYTCFYNLRMLDLHKNETKTEIDYSDDSFRENTKSKNQTLEEKLMNNNDENSFDSTPVNLNPTNRSTNFVDEPISVSDINLENQAKEEMKLMDIDLPEPKISTTDTKDNLKIIEGIGPKIEQLLYDNGVSTYAKIASMQAEEIKAILDEGGTKFSFHNPLNWPRQAVLARDGKIEELEELKIKLDRGL